jgi:hypothetical protein
MITEFTCGIFKAVYRSNEWRLLINRETVAHIHIDGSLIQYSDKVRPLFDIDSLVEIAVLMNNIKRQYKQLNNE